MGPSRSKQIFILFMVVFSFLLNHKPEAFALSKESTITNNLIPKIKAKINKYPHLICGVYIKPSWTNIEVNINGNKQFPAASLIKVPIAVALLKEIDNKRISFDQVLTLKQHHIAQGAGKLKNKKIGTKVKLREAFELMLEVSDNTATNLLIDSLGGIKACNQKITNLGLKQTQLHDYLVKFSNSRNTTSPKELVTLLQDSLLDEKLLSLSSRVYLKNILTNVNNKSLLKKGLGPFTTFPHKTGTIGISVGDAGIIYLPFLKRVGIAVIVKRPWNDIRANKLIQEIGSVVYKEIR